MERTILHCDLNGFYASVECLLNPSLKDVPMAVGGDPENRHGIILAKNELAKKYGIVTAETIWQAKKKCPDLVLVSPHHQKYSEYSKLVNNIYNDYSDLIEPFGIDESWIDVTNVQHLFGNGKEIADTIRKRVRAELGLTISVGVSFNKIFAKLGSDYKKPDATTIITRENYKELLYGLPVNHLLFVGKAVNKELEKLAIRTIGELAASNRTLLSIRMGKTGEMIHDYANGLDDSPVKPATEEREMKSVGNGMTFKRNLVGIEDITIGVSALADEVASRMRRYGVKCHTIMVTIKDDKLKTITRQVTLETPTQLAKVLRDTSVDIISQSWDLNKPIRMLTVTGNNLVKEHEEAKQLSLFEQKTDEDIAKREKIESAIDGIRKKYGKGAVNLGNILNNDIGVK